jgi:hypothetical protein
MQNLTLVDAVKISMFGNQKSALFLKNSTNKDYNIEDQFFVCASEISTLLIKINLHPTLIKKLIKSRIMKKIFLLLLFMIFFPQKGEIGDFLFE